MKFVRSCSPTKQLRLIGPDNVPCRNVKEFAYELAEPITTIFNTSLQSGVVPVVSKVSNIIPIPKVQSSNLNQLKTFLVDHSLSTECLAMAQSLANMLLLGNSCCDVTSKVHARSWQPLQRLNILSGA